MKNALLALVLLSLWSCQEKVQEKQLLSGTWRGQMLVAPKESLPFNFTVSQSDDHKTTITLINADERIKVDEIRTKGDSIIIQMPVFEGYIAARYTDSTITGQFIKKSLDRYVPFSANFGVADRFTTVSQATYDVSGIWETNFGFDGDEPYPAKGIFYQKDQHLRGTFRTETGDYRYLEGVVDGDSLKLSTFDGAHVFLFKAKITDSTLQGTFYSGNHFKENFKAKRNAAFELANANGLTYLKEGYDKLAFEFPDTSGKMVSLNDPEFKGKVTLVQIMGTWCPNCLDETTFYVDYLKNNPNKDLKVVALAFEYAKTKEKAFDGINRLKSRVGVNYPVLLAQMGTSSKSKANEKLPMLNHVLSYPTTIYIDKKGMVRKIHTGFNGPATGEKHQAFKKEFAETLAMLLAE